MNNSQNGRIQNGRIQNRRIQNGRNQNGRIQNGRNQNGRIQNGRNHNVEKNRMKKNNESMALLNSIYARSSLIPPAFLPKLYQTTRLISKNNKYQNILNLKKLSSNIYSYPGAYEKRKIFLNKLRKLNVGNSNTNIKQRLKKLRNEWKQKMLNNINRNIREKENRERREKENRERRRWF